MPSPIRNWPESFSVSDDGLAYTFKLRQGVKFHNGDDLTADDVKFSFDRLRAKDSGYSYGSQVETIASVDVVDPLTVQFKLSKRTGPFLIYMAFPGSSIVPKKLVEVRPRPERPAGRQRSVQVRQLSAAPGHPVREESELLRGAASRISTRWSTASSPDITALTNAVMSG